MTQYKTMVENVLCTYVKMVFSEIVNVPEEFILFINN